MRREDEAEEVRIVTGAYCGVSPVASRRAVIFMAPAEPTSMLETGARAVKERMAPEMESGAAALDRYGMRAFWWMGSWV